MAYSYTNTTAGDQKVLPIALDMSSDYARVADEPNLCRVTNKTASLEQPELVTYRCNLIDRVSTSIPVVNPAKSSRGVQYVVKLETVDRQTQADGSFIDEPITATLTIRHPMSNNWSNGKIAAQLMRLVGACMKDQTTTGTEASTTDSNWRFEDLMRSGLAPVED
jgi:hypothetical protein